MKRWILALVMLGLSVVPALAETAVTTGMCYQYHKSIPERVFGTY